MKTVSYIAFAATLLTGLNANVHAATLKVLAAGTEMHERPLIPLEKSLIPSHRFVRPSSTTAIDPSAGDYHSMANAIVRGLLVANRTGEIAYAAPLSYKVQDVVRNLRRGRALNKASRYSGVSSRVVSRLLQLGHGSLRM
ncbi:hypothetical protein [Altericista sp. CCNU0014]|uniref:hypothetical protein n=1 Tax=Altericista sp. CCNU0014 TaxID=3082949 RepID=UPI0038512511